MRPLAESIGRGMEARVWVELSWCLDAILLLDGLLQGVRKSRIANNCLSTTFLIAKSSMGKLVGHPALELRGSGHKSGEPKVPRRRGLEASGINFNLKRWRVGLSRSS